MYRCLFQCLMSAALAACLLQAPAARAQPVSEPSRIIIAGDAIASGHETARPPRMGWGQAVSLYFESDVRILSQARLREIVSGDLSHAAQLAERDIAANDLVLVQLMTPPDSGEAPSLAQAIVLTRRMVMAVRALGARPILLTPPASLSFDAVGQPVPADAAALAELSALSAQEKIPLIDLNAASIRWMGALGKTAATDYFFHDPATGFSHAAELHERGASAFACLVAAELVRLALIPEASAKRDLDCNVPKDHAAKLATQTRPSIIETADAIARVQAAPHGGYGMTIASPFFESAPELHTVMRQRVLHDGASIGLHAHGKDEIYYVVSGRGEIVIDGKLHTVGAGTAILTRDGSSHSLRQAGKQPLTLLIVYARDQALAK